MINETLKPTGELEIILKGPDGKIKEQKTVPNLVVNSGKYAIASRLIGTATAVFSHMALGSGVVAAVAGDTTLGTPYASTRPTVTVTGGTGSVNTVTYSATFAPGNSTGSVTEAGIFNALTGGSMLARTVFNSVYKDTLDTLTINWTITFN